MDINKQSIIIKIISVLKNYPVKRAYLFGSYALNTHIETSDVDILVEFSDSIGLQYGSLYVDLKETLQKEPGLMTVDGLKERSSQFYENVMSSLEVIYEH